MPNACKRCIAETERRLDAIQILCELLACHVKAEHRMDRNYLKCRDGDRINAVLAAAGYNFGLLLRCLSALLRALFQAILASRFTVQTV